MIAGTTLGQGAAAIELVAAPVAISANAEHALRSDWSGDLWRVAKLGDAAAFKELLANAGDVQPGDQTLQSRAALLRTHLADRETKRAERLAEIKGEFEKHIAGTTDLTLARALRSAIEWQTTETNKESVLADARVRELVSRADAAAHRAEKAGDALVAGELFVLLDLLNETEGKYRDDVRRIAQRQEMLRLYAPVRLWEMRNERQNQFIEAAKAEGKDDAKPLPPYNAFGDEWQEKLRTIDQELVERAIAYTTRHVEQVSIATVLAGGLEALHTMATTEELKATFPTLGDDALRTRFVAIIDDEIAQLAARKGPVDAVLVSALLTRVRKANEETLKLPLEAVWHEFGSGALGRLDEYSQVIWPDELRRFQKNTQGRFVGVGIQIEYDDIQNIRVVTPLEGTPAQRAGVHPGDLITHVDDRALYGLSLDQAVDVITGPPNTKVKLTVERTLDDDIVSDGRNPGAKAEKKTMDFTLVRSQIKVGSVKGWERSGVREDAWNWYIDPVNKIGYTRLTQFSDTTGQEFDRAIREMKKDGLSGLVLDLRFNPGGLLDEAVRISRRFVDTPAGLIVATKSAGGRLENPEYSEPEMATLAKLPVVVLINEGSASASEIVSGALRKYSDKGEIDAVLVGARSFGKGSVQNVWPLTTDSMIKVTTAYYTLPDQSIIHRRKGSTNWGVNPHLAVEMLPSQNSEAITLRRNADIIPLDETGESNRVTEARPDPQDLITKGIDLQLETALLLLRGRVESKAVAQAPGDRGAPQRANP
jgi:carboxyl-terminal processing protease